MVVVKSKLKSRFVASTFALAIGFVAGVGLNVAGVTSAMAQGLSGAQAPAEFPPASYTGRQYVDSRGCVYVRAGANGTTNWVPRVTRSREVICGMKPSKRTAAAAPAPRPAPKAAVAPAPARVAAAPTTTTRRVVVQAPKPTPQPTATTVRRIVNVAPVATSPTIRRIPASPQVVRRTVTNVPKTTAPKRTVINRSGVSACPGAAASSQRYINSGRDLPVRCGPQALAPSKSRITAGRVATRTATATAPVPVPQGYRRVNPSATTAAPQGYRSVWQDDRLNANRGIQGQRVVASTSTQGLVAPKRVIRKAVSPQAATRVAVPQPRAPQPKAATAGRYVQVGTFRNMGNATATARRLKQTGMPVRLGKLTNNGTVYDVVLAGPFASTAQLNVALRVARQSGFSDAFVR